MSTLSDAQIKTALSEFLVSGYRTEARIIAHLAELEQRKLHLKAGSESLFHYCTHVLRLSNSEAFHRITAARVARKFPIVFRLVEQRQLHLTAVCLLRDYLTPENHQELLAEACHKTKWQIEELLARRFPRPDVESKIRKLPAPRRASVPIVSGGPIAPALPAIAPSAERADERAPIDGEPQHVRPQQAQRSQHGKPAPALIEPLSEARYRIQLNASAALKEKLERLRALTLHSNPSGDIARVIEAALDVALEKVERERFAKTHRPRAPRQRSLQKKLSAPNAERAAVRTDSTNVEPRRRAHVPNAVLREIAERDGLRCSYRSADGCRCTARAFLQVHHEHAWARGGGETTDNLRLLCFAHNQLLAERDFGSQKVALRRDERRCRAPTEQSG